MLLRPAAVCLAWRAYRGGGTCWATPPVRDPPRDRYCSAEVRGPGHCEVADVTYGQGGVLLGGVKRAVMTRQCGAFPAVVRCADAPEFAAFAAASLAFSYPAAAEARQAQQDGDPAPAPRGIVMAIHDGLVVSAYAVVRLLRHHGCALPVEMWAFPGELTRRHAAYLDQLVGMPGVALREVAAGKAALCKDPKRCFAIKPYALFHTRCPPSPPPPPASSASRHILGLRTSTCTLNSGKKNSQHQGLVATRLQLRPW